MTIQENNQFKDHSKLHNYRTELPNIIFEKGLDPYALTLYAYYKKVAGDLGGCFLSNGKIAEATGMSVTTLKDRRAILHEKGLIKVTERMKSDGEHDTTLIEIIDLWDENFKELSSRFSNEGGRSPKNRRVSPGDHKEDPIKNDFDFDFESADEKMIFFLNHQGQHQSIEKEKIRTHLKSFSHDIISAVLHSLEEKPRKVSDIFNYAETIAINMKKEKKHDNRDQRKSVRREDPPRTGAFINGERVDRDYGRLIEQRRERMQKMQEDGDSNL